MGIDSCDVASQHRAEGSGVGGELVSSLGGGKWGLDGQGWVAGGNRFCY